MPAERMDWRQEPTSQFQVHPPFKHKPSPPLSACAALKVFRVFVHNRCIRHCSLSSLATALPQSNELARPLIFSKCN